ncbi:MAG: hypothetical protein K2Y71_15610 [Xanthobacteraceae bacterium]|nr:hypothetical protein [Xanthobacteraceae bacterium]
MDEPAAEQRSGISAAPRATDKRTHDVHFTTSARESLVHAANRGVTVADDHIAWTFDGKGDAAPFKNIVEVCQQTGAGAHRFLRICQITFADRYKLMITNGNEFAVPTEAQRVAYRGFMHDLHARLAAHAAVRDRPPIEFKAGFTAEVHRRLAIRVALWILVFAGAPLALFLMTGETKPFLILLGALVVGTIFWRLTHANAPRSYDPARLPKELVE